MRYMLDTNIISGLLRNPRGLAARRAAALADAVCVSVIVAAALRYGVAKRRPADLTRKVEVLFLAIPVVPLEGLVDWAYVIIRTELESAGRFKRHADRCSCLRAWGNRSDRECRGVRAGRWFAGGELAGVAALRGGFTVGWSRP